MLTVCRYNSFVCTLALCLHVEPIGFSRSYKLSGQQILFVKDYDCKSTDRLKVWRQLYRSPKVSGHTSLFQYCILLPPLVSTSTSRHETLTFYPQSAFPIQCRLCASDLSHIMERTSKYTPPIGSVILTSTTNISRSTH